MLSLKMIVNLQTGLVKLFAFNESLVHSILLQNQTVEDFFIQQHACIYILYTVQETVKILTERQQKKQKKTTTNYINNKLNFDQKRHNIR